MATILVVDDEQPIVDLLCELVHDAGHTSLAASNGRDALSLAQRHHPSLIISDVMMPIMDGYGLLRAIEADPTLAHIMVIMISAGTSVAQFGSRVIKFIAKPLDLTVIEGLLQAIP